MFSFLQLAHNQRFFSTALALSVLLGGISITPRVALASVQLEQAEQVVPDDFELPEFYKTCSDSERGILQIGRGACQKQSQFSQGDTSFTYWHDKLNGEYNEDCTAVFSGIPLGFSIEYRQEDEVVQDGTGLDRIEEVCWLRLKEIK